MPSAIRQQSVFVVPGRGFDTTGISTEKTTALAERIGVGMGDPAYSA
jgi:hypothetical protein